MSHHGELTPKVKTYMEGFLKRETDQFELRLIPYVQYIMVNEQVIEPKKISQPDRRILAKWREAGHIEGGASGLSVTEEFWQFMCDVLKMAYVDYRNEE